MADAYRSRRLFIAGDSAHSHPPYGGFGLNNGLEDIVNLGWKLAAVLQGWGGESLLDSYGEERRAVFWETGQDFIAAGIRSDREFLERYSPERDRAEFEEAWERMGRGTRVGTYEPNYEGSPVVWGPPGGLCSAHGSHTYHRAGRSSRAAERAVERSRRPGGVRRVVHAAGVRRARCGRGRIRACGAVNWAFR